MRYAHFIAMIFCLMVGCYFYISKGEVFITTFCLAFYYGILYVVEEIKSHIDKKFK